jgi:hypothetical protein
MRKIILYIDNTENLDYVIDRPEIGDIASSQLTVVLQLSELSREVIPLIGDLSELRVQKYQRLLSEWHEDQTTKFKLFNPIVLQSSYNNNDFEQLLDTDAGNEVFVYDKVNSKLSRILDRLKDKYKFNLHIIAPEHNFKAGE